MELVFWVCMVAVLIINMVLMIHNIKYKQSIDERADEVYEYGRQLAYREENIQEDMHLIREAISHLEELQSERDAANK